MIYGSEITPVKWSMQINCTELEVCMMRCMCGFNLKERKYIAGTAELKELLD